MITRHYEKHYSSLDHYYFTLYFYLHKRIIQCSHYEKHYSSLDHYYFTIYFYLHKRIIQLMYCTLLFYNIFLPAQRNYTAHVLYTTILQYISTCTNELYSSCVSSGSGSSLRNCFRRLATSCGLESSPMLLPSFSAV